MPVIFDFRGTETYHNVKHIGNILCCLFSTGKEGEVELAMMSHEAFINNAMNGAWFKKLQEAQNKVVKPQINNSINRSKIESQFVYEGGRWKKRWRFR